MRRTPARLILVVVLTFAYLMTYPLVIGRADESHLLHGARRVLDGQVLYRDFFEIITPLAFYFIAAVYWLGGTTLLAARTASALVDGLGAAALFALVRQVAGVWEALLATLVFVVLCVPVWPYASAHWISTALGLAAATILLIDRWQHSQRLRPLVAGVLTGAAICAQQQRGVFLLAWLLAALPVMAASYPSPTRWRRLRAEALWSVGGAGAVTLIVLGHAAWTASLDDLVDHLYRFARDSYGPQNVGADRWASIHPLTDVYATYTWRWLFQIAPLFLVGEGIALERYLRGPWPRPVAVRACCWLLGLFMALSIWYLPDVIHVSFVTPFLIVPAARLLRGARSWPGWSRLPGGRCAVTAALLFATVTLGVKGVRNVAQARAGVTARLETGFGTLDGAEYLEQLLSAIRRNLVPEPEGRSLVFSYPDDAWFYLALPADAATRFDIFFESFPQRYVDEVVAALRARRPGTVVLMTLARAPVIEEAVAEEYDLAEEVYPYRIYVRRPPAAAKGAGARE